MMGSLSSCDKLLEVESKVVVYEKDNTLNHATDTVYSVMGIVKQLQKIADRTVILGEIRGDLMTITDHASDNIREIYEYDFTKLNKDNIYDNPVDYYAVINNCNYYLSKADTNYIRNGEKVFIREYVAVLAYRAWTYLQMAQVYGKVPFVTQPVLSGDVKVDDFQLLGIKDIANQLIDDLVPYVDLEIPSYGSLGGSTNGDGTTSETHKSEKLFVPVRLILGDLCLWAEKYDQAALYYHDYLSNLSQRRAIATTTASMMWRDKDFVSFNADTYSPIFGSNYDDNIISYIPMESQDYNGIVSDLPNVFNSTKKNDYFYQVTFSPAMSSLSQSQKYAYHDVNPNTHVSQLVYVNPDLQELPMNKGDLRLYSVISQSTVTDRESSKYSEKRQTVRKINAEKVSLYRNDQVYLRFAEALNRAGLPETAFAILKNGLCEDNIYGLDFYDEPIISSEELSKAEALGMSDVYKFAYADFRKAEIDVTAGNTLPSFVDPTIYNTMGIHSRGCGDAEIDTSYVIPNTCTTLADSIREVELLILNEMALETCFEGNRFGDILRIAQHRGTADTPDAEFFAVQIASRESDYADKNGANFNNQLYNKLLDSKNWFLRLP